MAKLSIVAGTTSKLLDVFIQDSSSTTGAGLTGLAFNSAGLTGYYYREGAASATAITLATMTLGTWATGGFVVVDGTNMPGCYQIGIPNAAIAAGAKSVLIMLKGATNMAPLLLEIELTAVDNQDGVHFGLTCLPNTAVTTNGSLITSGTGADQLQVASGIASSDAKKINAVSTASVTTINANQGTTQPVNFTGTAGAALVKSDAVDIAGAAVSTTSAQIGVNVVNYNGQAAQTDANNLPKVDLEGVSGAVLSTHATGMLPADLRDIVGAAVSASTAQLGVNAVNIAGQAAAVDANNLLKVDVEDWKGGAVNALVGGKVDGLTNIRSATAQAGASGTITLDASASATDNFYKGAWILLLSGTGAGQARLCSGYTGASKVAAIAPNWTTAPDATSVFAVLPAAGVDIELWLNTAVAATTAGIPDVNTKNIANAAAQLDANNLIKVDVEDVNGAATLPELAQGQPATTPSLAAAIMLLYMAMRNALTTTASTKTIANDAGTVICKQTLSDNGTTYSQAKLVTGP